MEEEKAAFQAWKKQSVSEKLKELGNSAEGDALREKLLKKPCGQYGKHMANPGAGRPCKFGDKCLYGHFLPAAAGAGGG